MRQQKICAKKKWLIQLSVHHLIQLKSGGGDDLSCRTSGHDARCLSAVVEFGDGEACQEIIAQRTMSVMSERASERVSE